MATIGLIGAGHIGGQLARLAVAGGGCARGRTSSWRSC